MVPLSEKELVFCPFNGDFAIEPVESFERLARLLFSGGIVRCSNCNISSVISQLSVPLKLGHDSGIWRRCMWVSVNLLNSHQVRAGGGGWLFPVHRRTASISATEICFEPRC